MDQRQLAAFVLMAIMVLALVAFLAFWRGNGLDRQRVPGWRRWRRWIRNRRR